MRHIIGYVIRHIIGPTENRLRPEPPERESARARARERERERERETLPFNGSSLSRPSKVVLHPRQWEEGCGYGQCARKGVDMGNVSDAATLAFDDQLCGFRRMFWFGPFKKKRKKRKKPAEGVPMVIVVRPLVCPLVLQLPSVRVVKEV